MLFKIIILL